MSTNVDTSGSSKSMRISGIVLSTLISLFLIMDGVMKLMKPTPAPVAEAMTKLAYPLSTTTTLGVLLLASVLLYILPRTAILGAILLTGYLGGAVSAHLRAGGTAFEQIFPAVFGAIVWGGLWFRDSRIRDLIPLSRQ